MSTSARREREREERRTSILEAAEQVFAQKGFINSTMDDIASAAELSKGTLYLYFKNKDELFVGHTSRALERLGTALVEANKSEIAGLERVRSLLLIYATHVRSNQSNFANAMQWVLSSPPLDTETQSFKCLRSCLGTIISQFASAVRTGQDDGSIRPELDPLATGLRMWSAMIGAMMLSLRSEHVRQSLPEDMVSSAIGTSVDELVDLLCRGLAASNGPRASSKDPS